MYEEHYNLNNNCYKITFKLWICFPFSAIFSFGFLSDPVSSTWSSSTKSSLSTIFTVSS